MYHAGILSFLQRGFYALCFPVKLGWESHFFILHCFCDKVWTGLPVGLRPLCTNQNGLLLCFLLWSWWCKQACHVHFLFSCSIRVSTWNRLNYLKNGVLKSALKTAMVHDPISPVLSLPHMDALGQRLLNILATVKQCTDQFGPDVVLVEDRMTLAHS